MVGEDIGENLVNVGVVIVGNEECLRGFAEGFCIGEQVLCFCDGHLKFSSLENFSFEVCLELLDKRFRVLLDGSKLRVGFGGGAKMKSKIHLGRPGNKFVTVLIFFVFEAVNLILLVMNLRQLEDMLLS